MKARNEGTWDPQRLMEFQREWVEPSAPPPSAAKTKDTLWLVQKRSPPPPPPPGCLAHSSPSSSLPHTWPLTSYSVQPANQHTGLRSPDQKAALPRRNIHFTRVCRLWSSAQKSAQSDSPTFSHLRANIASGSPPLDAYESQQICL